MSPKPGYYFYFTTLVIPDIEKHVQNKISHIIIFWMFSMPKLRGHKGFGCHDYHDEAYSLIV